MKKLSSGQVIALLLLAVVAFQALPHGIIEYSLYGSGEAMINTEIGRYSYFSLYPFLHLNFAPLVSAVASAFALIVILLNLSAEDKQEEDSRPLSISIVVAMAAALITLVTGPTAVAGIVAALLMITFVLQVASLRKSQDESSGML